MKPSSLVFTHYSVWSVPFSCDQQKMLTENVSHGLGSTHLSLGAAEVNAAAAVIPKSVGMGEPHGWPCPAGMSTRIRFRDFAQSIWFILSGM